MIMTQIAMMDPGPSGNSLFSRCCRSIAHFFGFGDRPVSRHIDRLFDVPNNESFDDLQPDLRIVPEPSSDAPTSVTELRWRRHKQLLHRPTSALPEDERHARQHAIQGLYAARAGTLEAAEHHFTQAASCINVDLCEIPGFWQLPRSGMIAAIRAYEATDRLREASALNARIRTQMRPRPIAPTPENVTELPSRRRMPVSSNS